MTLQLLVYCLPQLERDGFNLHLLSQRHVILIVRVCSVEVLLKLFSFGDMPHLHRPLQLNRQAISSTIE